MSARDFSRSHKSILEIPKHQSSPVDPIASSSTTLHHPTIHSDQIFTATSHSILSWILHTEKAPPDAPLLEAPNCIASSTTSRRVNFTSKRSNRFNNSVWLRPLQRSFPFYPGRSVQEITANYCIQKWINPCQSCTETSLHPQNLPSCPHNF